MKSVHGFSLQTLQTFVVYILRIPYYVKISYCPRTTQVLVFLQKYNLFQKKLYLCVMNTELSKNNDNTEVTEGFISFLSDYGFKVTFGNESDTRFCVKPCKP